ncbi:MAG: hypothetical protein LBF72_00030 [Holosporales bacterium]|nr:hypothetical protein [Holosporales bacterium]
MSGPLSKPSKSVFGYADPVFECSRTSKYAPLLCSVSPSQNSDFEGFERGPVSNRIRRRKDQFKSLCQLGLPSVLRESRSSHNNLYSTPAQKP